MVMGIGELIALVVAGVFVLVPIGLFVWGLVMLGQIRSVLDDMRARLARSEQTLPSSPAPEA